MGKHVGLLVFVVILIVVLCLSGCELFESSVAKWKWKMYVKSDVYKDPNTYIPILNDFGEYVGLVDDSTSLIDEENKYENSVVGFRTWVFSESTTTEIGIDGDDGVALYLDSKLVCNKPNAEDPMVYCEMELTEGWHKVEALVYNGPLHISLEFGKKLSDIIDEMDANHSE